MHGLTNNENRQLSSDPGRFCWTQNKKTIGLVESMI